VRKDEQQKLVREFVRQWGDLPEDRRRGDVYDWIGLRMGCGRTAAADLIREALGTCPQCRRVLDLAGVCTMAGIPGSGCPAVANG
jgi:hypothetical protein